MPIPTEIPFQLSQGVPKVVPEIEEALAYLGDRLLRSTDDVIAAVTARASRKREMTLDPAVEESFVRLGTLATEAVARWVAGASVDGAFAAGEEVSRVFAPMVANSDVPLGEVVRHCQYWRDSCEEALAAAAEDCESERACELARGSIHLAADHVLASMSAIFDAERHRMQLELTRRQEELAFLATHDGLTKLANRSLVVERLERMLARSGDEPGGDGVDVAVLFIDLDGFKAINDTLGHSAGDRLLAATAARLRAAVRAGDTLGRLGGDEFVVLTSPLPASTALQELAARLRDAFAEPFAISLDRGPLRITASIGVAVARPGCSAAVLLHDADQAMYSAKGRRRTQLAGVAVSS